jgi:iron complex outermembrane receptor protein
MAPLRHLYPPLMKCPLVSRAVQAALGWSALAWFPPATAQPVAPEVALPSVAVRATALRSNSGTKTDTPLIETPQSISVVTADKMRERGAQSVVEALRYTPGVQVNWMGNDELRNDWVSLRGFISLFNSDYRDGMQQLRYDQVRVRTEPYSLERIDIVRGPSSMLYGQGTPGGIVDKTTKRPRAEPLREVEVQLGSFERRQAAFDLGGPLDAAGDWSFRLTGLARDAQTAYRYDAAHSVPDSRRFLAPAFAWRPNASTSLTVLANAQEDRNGTTAGLLPPYRAMVGDHGFDRFVKQTSALSYLFEHRFNDDWQVRQHLRNQQGELEYQEISSFTQPDAAGRIEARDGFASRQAMHSVSVDNQLQGRLRHGAFEHTVLAGLDYRRLRGVDLYLNARAGPLDLWSPVYGQAIEVLPAFYDERERTTQSGVYLQDQVKFDRWALVLGGRQDHTLSHIDNLIDQRVTQESARKFSGRMGLAYLSPGGAVPYASYATSFDPQSGTAHDGNPFKPSTGRQFELGVKYQPKASRDLVAVSVFDISQRNLLTTDPVHAFFSVQQGEVTSRGVELEVKSGLTRNLELVGAATYNLVRIAQSNNGDVGKTPTMTPRQMVSAWLQHSQPDGPLRGLGWGGGLRYVGATFVDADNTLRNGGVALFDTAMHYTSGAWRFALKANNLFDKEVITCRYTWFDCRYGVPRSLLATATYHH